jgi:hypothetical protein
MADPFNFDAAAEAAGREFNVNPMLIKSIGMQESGLNPDAPTGAAGELGMMQIKPSTAADLGVDPRDPADAVRGTAKYLAQGLAQAEQMRAQGVDVDPATHAVMYYNGGPRGWHNADAYAQSVGGHYQQLAGGPAAPPAVDPGLAQLAAAGGGSAPGAGGPGAFLIPGTDTPVAAPPGRPLGATMAMMPPDLAALQRSGGSAAPGGAVPPSGAGGNEPPIDVDGIVEGLASGRLTMPPLPAGPGAAPAARGAPAGPAAPPGPSAGPQAAIDVPGLVQTFNQYSRFPAGIPVATQALGMLQKMAPEGFQVNTDGSLSPRAGFAQGEAAVAGAKSAAEEEQKRITAAVAPQRVRAGEGVVYPPGSPMAGAAPPGGAPGGAPATAGPPGAPGAGGEAAGVLTPTPGGGAMIAGTAPPQATETFYKRFDDLAKEADAARTGQYQANLLRAQLHQLPATGPATEFLGHMSAWAQQMGVPPDKLPKSLPAAGDVETANKLSTDLLGEVLRAQFPGRITNSDIQTMAPTIARATTPMAANDFLIDRVLGPKFQRDIDRYGHVAGLPKADPTLSSLSDRLYQWDQDPANSYGAYAKRAQDAAAAAVPPSGPAPPIAAPSVSPPLSAPPGGGAAGPRRSRFDPATGTIVPVGPR